MFFQALVFCASLELGGMFGGVYNYPAKEPIVMIPFYTSMDAEVSYRGLYVGGQMDCYFVALAVNNFSPFQNTYVFKLGYRDGGMTVGFEHTCYHPMQTYQAILITEGREWKPIFEGAVEKLFVRFEIGGER